MTRLWDQRLWVVVADGERARVMMPDVAEGHFRTVLRLGTLEYPHCPPPLHNQSVDEARNAFVADVARRLDDEAEKNSYDQLVVVAPPRVLHGIREVLGEVAQARVVGSLARDCSKIDDVELSRHLAQWWLAPAEAA